MGARLALGCSCIAFLGTLVAPVALLLAALWVVAVAFGASWLIVRGGGIGVARETFASIVLVASAVATAGLLRLVLVGIAAGPREPGQKRQRVIGPGGRVLRVLHQPKQESAAATGAAATLAGWLPDPWSIAGVLLLGFLLHRMGVRFPGWLVAVFVVTNLFFFGVHGLVWLAVGALRLPLRAYRFGVKSAYRAGAVTATLLVLSFGVVVAGAAAVAQLPPLRPQPVDERISELSEEVSFAESTRLLLVGLGEIVEPELTLRQDLAGFLAPLFERAQRDRVGDLASARPPADALLASLGPAGLDGTDTQALFQECMNKLWPEEFRKVERSIRNFARIARDEKHDITLSALIDTCEAYTNGRVDDMPRFFQTTTKHHAINWHRKRKYVVCTDVDLAATCPGPFDDPDTRIARQAALGQIEWCELRPLEKTLILERFVLELDYQEIADRHPGLSATRAKDTTNNILKKVRDKLGGQCARDAWHQ